LNWSHFADFYFKVVYFVYPRMGMFWILMPTKFNSTDFRFTQYISINALHCHQLQELNLNFSHQNKFVCQVLFLAVVGINHRHYQHVCFAFVMPFWTVLVLSYPGEPCKCWDLFMLKNVHNDVVIIPLINYFIFHALTGCNRQRVPQSHFKKLFVVLLSCFWWSFKEFMISWIVLSFHCNWSLFALHSTHTYIVKSKNIITFP